MADKIMVGNEVLWDGAPYNEHLSSKSNPHETTKEQTGAAAALASHNTAVDAHGDIRSTLNGKVDKVVGKGLSDENYTLAEKTKVANVPADTTAQLNEKANKAQEAWITPTLLNEWVNLPSGRDLMYRINQFNRVELKGGVSGGLVGTTVMKLPIGYRPSGTRAFTVYSGSGYGRVTVDTAGVVNVIYPSSNPNVYFDQVSFTLN